jgi:hypothetical protein
MSPEKTAAPCAFSRGLAVLSVRPKIAELVFQVYGRPLHPELFASFATKVIERPRYTAKLEITGAGHIITWRYQGLTLTEVATSATDPLPQKRRLMSHPLSGAQQDQIECSGGVTYAVDFSLDTVDSAKFYDFQKQLAGVPSEHSLVHSFDSSGRCGFGALSYIHVESRERSLAIKAFHTFPDDHAIVRSQSVFRLPQSR